MPSTESAKLISRLANDLGENGHFRSHITGFIHQRMGTEINELNVQMILRRTM